MASVLKNVFLALGCLLVVTAKPTNPFEVVNLVAPDGSAKASFISLGATLTEFWVKDKAGKFRDVALGYDNKTLYLNAPTHPYFGGVVGRYANRIRNSTFSIPPSNPVPPDGPNVYHITPNDNGGLDTLHGGTPGWDLLTWKIVARSKNSVTYGLHDPAGAQGFPGEVNAKVTYTLLSKGNWLTTMSARSSAPTPILLSSHVYWNLEAYKETQDIRQHELYIDASRVIGTDGILIPTGELLDVQGTAWDFRKPTAIGDVIDQAVGYCGTGCTGLDNAWIYDSIPRRKPGFSLYSPNSGIKLEVTTDQPALQIYSCNGIASGNIPRKAAQGGPSATYGTHSCLVVEQEGWIDAINHPEWGQDQIYGPGREYKWEALYKFSVVK